jgi:hypothetical protein
MFSNMPGFSNMSLFSWVLILLIVFLLVLIIIFLYNHTPLFDLIIKNKRKINFISKKFTIISIISLTLIISFYIFLYAYLFDYMAPDRNFKKITTHENVKLSVYFEETDFLHDVIDIQIKDKNNKEIVWGHFSERSESGYDYKKYTNDWYIFKTYHKDNIFPGDDITWFLMQKQ